MNNQTVHFKGIREKIIEILNTANDEILIAVAWFTDEKIIETLNNLSQRGVSISIIIYDDKINNKDLFKNLYYKKADIRVSKKLMHNKFCIVDSEIVINGSYNWTYSAHTNDENIQITKFNNDLTDTFKEQFYKLLENCKKIDNHFKHSINTIENELEYYNRYYDEHIKKINITPYFYKIEKFEKNPIHSSIKITDGFVIIQNMDYEYEFFRLLHFLKKEYNLKAVSKITNINFSLPPIYTSIEGINTNGNNVFKINLKKHILINEKRLVGYSGVKNKKYELNTITQIDQSGNIIISIKNCKKMPSGYYLVDFNCWEIYDSNLNKIKTHGYVVDYIDNVGYVNYILKENRRSYGLWDFNDNNLIENKFDYYDEESLKSYKPSRIKFLIENIVENQEFNIKLIQNMGFNILYFIELEQKLRLEGIIDHNNNVLIKSLTMLNNFIKDKDNKVVFHEFPCLISEPEFYIKELIIKGYNKEYELRNNTYKENIYNVLNKEIKTSLVKNKKNGNYKYYFYSDFNYKYKDFYEKIVNNNSNILEKDFYKIVGLIENEFYNGSFRRMMDADIQNSNHKLRLQINSFRETKKQQEKSCYIATMVYKDIEHPKVEKLRQFRDTVLSNYYLGRTFIKYYYKYSPSIVDKLKNKKNINMFIRRTLDLVIKTIKWKI